MGVLKNQLIEDQLDKLIESYDDENEDDFKELSYNDLDYYEDLHSTFMDEAPSQEELDKIKQIIRQEPLGTSLLKAGLWAALFWFLVFLYEHWSGLKL